VGDIAFSELLVIAIAAILCFGKDLPRVARKVGRHVGKARRWLLDIKEEVQRQLPMDEFDVENEPPAPTTTATAAKETCPICGGELQDPITKCPKCAKGHHEKCWIYSGSCGIAECGAKASPEASPPTSASSHTPSTPSQDPTPGP